MILSEHERRWVEVQFHQYCADVYAVRNKSIDIIDFSESVCALGEANPKVIRNVIGRMLNDTYYQSTKRDIILLAHLHGKDNAYIGKLISMSRQGVSKYIKANLDGYTPLPRCGIDEDTEIYKFIKTLEKIKHLGAFTDGSVN